MTDHASLPVPCAECLGRILVHVEAESLGSGWAWCEHTSTLVMLTASERRVTRWFLQSADSFEAAMHQLQAAAPEAAAAVGFGPGAPSRH